MHHPTNAQMATWVLDEGRNDQHRFYPVSYDSCTNGACENVTMAREVAEKERDGWILVLHRKVPGNQSSHYPRSSDIVVGRSRSHPYPHSSYGKAVHARLATLGFRHFIPIHTPCTFPRTHSLTPDQKKIPPSILQIRGLSYRHKHQPVVPSHVRN